ncbi:uncharacterized protein LOC122385835 isoform X2 [Amphibalanus amphitrite]|uniref:uncharacterized protein LOC122385835 isoform X2 n=1 Tax=Amphibalanus amphitrite TaxID=1232801 RepID=UPI001C921A39|nr:uncharacterized protein LOC122385835 isoform X2 [Amphibalanus amphitrite]
MSAAGRWRLGLACLALLSVRVSDCVRITELHVPPVVEHNTNTSAVLDCEYHLGEQSDISMLIVRWFFNDLSAPVYQWVKGRQPSAAGILKGRVNLDHEVSSDPLMKHRALSLINPTIELGGKYTCKVTTEVNFDIRSKQMVVYAPARTMNLTEDKPSPTSVNISCLVEGVYPAPKLELFVTQEGNKDSRKPLADVTEWTETTDDSLYDAAAHATIEDSSLEGNTEFECVMSVPDTPYMEKRTITYSYGAVLAASKEMNGASGPGVLSSGLLGVCLLSAISLYR